MPHRRKQEGCREFLRQAARIPDSATTGCLIFTLLEKIILRDSQVSFIHGLFVIFLLMLLYSFVLSPLSIFFAKSSRAFLGLFIFFIVSVPFKCVLLCPVARSFL
ncbi:unnamed protein product [Schistocephalus solidus]|uniref:Uncharacterized protein n=1 Tax=Schistocephalus solidus TaxID=70667 RepID=A0A0X3Q5D7_SCHSO|nr:unnamed protein product [Schistocephalus solidus]